MASGALGGLGVHLLLGGVLAHGWGMYAKHRSERLTGNAAPWWHTALYWVCWAILALLILLVLGRAMPA